MRRHLAAGRWEEAKAITLEHAPADSHAEVELFFTSTADRLTGEGRSVGPARAAVATENGHHARVG